MSLIRDGYRAEILGGLADAGEEVQHVFLEADAGVLRERLDHGYGFDGTPEEFTLFLPASSVPRRPRRRSPRELLATGTPKGWFPGEVYTRPRRTREEGGPRH